MEHDECTRCGEQVPALRFCVCCGESLVPDERLRRFAAAPHERRALPHVVSTIFPHLPRSEMRAFRLALVLALGGIVVVGWLGLYSVAVVLCAATLPILLLVYLYDVDVYESHPLPVLGFTVLWGVAVGVLGALVLRALAPSATETAIEGGGSLATVLVPLCAFFVAVLGTVLVLLPYAHFNDLLDGTTFGAVSASFASSAQMVVLALPFFSEGISPLGATAPWLLRLVELAVAVPLLWAALGATVSGSFWLRYRTSQFVRGTVGALGSPLVAIPVAAAILLCVVVARLELPRWASAATLLVAVVIALLHLRRLIHSGLVNEALEAPIGPEVACTNCQSHTPSHLFCGTCGVARRALPKGIRDVLPVR